MADKSKQLPTGQDHVKASAEPAGWRRQVRRQWRKTKDWWRFLPETTREMYRVGMVLVLVGGVGAGIWQVGLPAWRGWKQKRALGQVEDFAGRNDYRNAVLALRRATDAAPGDPRVWREAATFLAKIGSPEAVVAQQNLARLDPSDLGLRVAMVTEALRFGDAATAAGGVAALEKAGRNDTTFHRLAAAVALALGRADEFERHLENLVQSDPGDASAKFNLAALRVWSVDEEISRKAAEDLVVLTREPALRLRAALERLKFAAATRDPVKVDAEVVSLLAVFAPEAAGAPVRDVVGEPPGWSALVAGLKRVAAGAPGDVAMLARWMGGLEQGRAALAWMDTLPAAIREANEVAGAAADLAARVNDLPRLRRLLEGGAWGAMPAETIDLALASRVQRTKFGEQRGRGTWDDAVATARDSLAGLRGLARLAGMWRDRDGADKALQAVVDRYPREYWACEALRVSYASQRDTDKLWRLYQVWAPRVPEHKAVQQTWIMLGALLNRSDAAQLQRAEALLAEEGAEPEPATVLALVAAQWRAGRIDRAAATLDRLPMDQRTEPRALLWDAVLAAARDDAGMLEEALARLPEEKLMREEQQVLKNALAENKRRQRAAERAAARAAEMLAMPAAEAPAAEGGADAVGSEKSDTTEAAAPAVEAR